MATKRVRDRYKVRYIFAMGAVGWFMMHGKVLASKPFKTRDEAMAKCDERNQEYRKNCYHRALRAKRQLEVEG